MIKRIPIEELTTGMSVYGVENDAGAVFFVSNVVMHSTADVTKLVGDGYRFVHVELPVAATGPGRRAVDPELSREVRVARSIRDEAGGVVKKFFDAVSTGGKLNTDDVNSTVGNMVESVLRNPFALASLAMLKNSDDYTLSHSINVCILSLSIARSMGLDRSRLQDLGVGAVLHDIGKILIPAELLRKPSKLNDMEFEVMKRHTALGADFLSSSKGISKDARLIALEHHERLNGTGYPDGLKSHEIGYFSRIVAVADIYDAMTSARVYQQPVLPEEALRKMYLWRGNKVDAEMVERLIKCVGIYPLGSIVELNTSELAIVRAANSSSPLKPVISVVHDSKKPLSEHFEVDLEKDDTRWITCTKDPNAYSTLINTLLGGAA